jgi:hypothetical protein
LSYRQKAKPETKLAYTPRVQTIISLYDQANIEYIPTYDDQKEMEFYDALSRNTDPMRHRRYVTTIYRVKTDKRFSINKSFDEALVYYMNQELETQSGLNLYDNRRHEFFWNPVTRPTRNAEGQATKFEPKYYEPLFTLKFTPENVDAIIEKSMNMVSDFCVALAARTGPNEFVGNPLTILNLEDFKRGSWQELVDMNTYRVTKKESALSEWRKEGENIKRANRNIVTMQPNIVAPPQPQHYQQQDADK